MLVIRERQIAVLQSVVDEALQLELAQHFRETRAEALADVSEEDLLSIIGDAIAQARHYRLTRRRSFADFAAKCLFFDRHFYERLGYKQALETIAAHPNPDSQMVLLDALAEGTISQ